MTRTIDRRTALLATFAFCLATGATIAAEPGKKPVITISRKTTHLTAPLRKDGRVDYLAALNARYGKGVTPQTNAVVGIIEALGPDGLDEKTRPALLKALGVTLPAGKEFPEYPDIPLAACDTPWENTDHPALAKWLEANATRVDLLVKAARRRRCYVPCVPSEGDAALWNAVANRMNLLIMIGQKLTAAQAMQHVGRGRTDAALANVETALRIAAHQQRRPLLIDRLVGAATTGLAAAAATELARSAPLSAAQARRLLGTMGQLPAPLSLAEVVDVGERYFSLDYTRALADGRVRDANIEWLGNIAKPSVEDGPAAAEEKAWISFVVSVLKSRKHMHAVDWNAMLKRCNAQHDQLVKALRLATFAARKEAFRPYDARRKLGIRQARAVWVKWGKPDSPGKAPPSAISAAWLAGAIDTLYAWMSLTRVLESIDLMSSKQELGRLTVALAGYRAEHGAYPRKLSGLAPGWLKTLPKDVCSGKDFVYKRDGKGYVLYSVGRNMRDDGGRNQPGDPMPDEGPDDIVVRIEAK